MDTELIVIGGIAVLITVLFLVPVLLKSRNVDLTGSSDEKPEWMRTTPPAETMAAKKDDRESGPLFGHEEGERVAAPFAEQIEDILRSRLESDSDLSKYKIDLGTAPDGGLEIWVDGKMYPDIKSLPDEQLRQVFQESVEQWDKG